MSLKEVVAELKEMDLPKDSSVELYFHSEDIISENRSVLFLCHKDSPHCQGKLILRIIE